MKTVAVFALLFLVVSSLPGCRVKPSKVITFHGPSPEVFYTVEVWEDSGAMSSDFTRVFAHFEHNHKSDKVMFLDGAYLIVGDVRWNGKNDATVCLSGGRVNSFNESISLRAGGSTYDIRNRVDQNCPNYRPLL